MLVLGGLAVASLEKQRNKRNKNSEAATVPDAVPDAVPDQFLVPALPYEKNDLPSQEAMEQGQTLDNTEFRPLLNIKSNNNGPERRR